jgi:hypothetical protein
MWPNFKILGGMILLVMIAAACGGGGNRVLTPSVTPRPTGTPTPRSTALPEVSTPIPVGAEDRPIKILVVGEQDSVTSRLVNDLSGDVTHELENFRLGWYEGLTVEFEVVETQQEALTRICNSPDTAAFVDAFTYIAAEQNCGALPTLQIERDGQPGSNFDLIVFRQRIGAASNLAGRVFCTMDVEGRTNFVHPALAFKVMGIDPLDDFSEIATGFESDTEMILAMTGRYEPAGRPRCDGAALPTGRLDEIEEELLDEDREQNLTQSQFNQVAVLDVTGEDAWEPIPYDILVFPPNRLMPEFLREEVTDAFTTLEADEGSAHDNLVDLLGHDDLVPVTPLDYDDFREWLVEKAGWNLAASPIN